MSSNNGLTRDRIEKYSDLVLPDRWEYWTERQRGSYLSGRLRREELLYLVCELGGFSDEIGQDSIKKDGLARLVVILSEGDYHE